MTGHDGCRLFVFRKGFVEFDDVPVRVFEESDDARARVHRAGLAHELDTLRLEVIRGCIDIGNLEREMPPGVAEIVGLLLVPVVGHFDRRAIVFPLVADEGVGKTSVRVFVLAQYFHAQDAGVEIQCFILVEYSDHGVIESEIGFTHFILGYLSCGRIASAISS